MDRKAASSPFEDSADSVNDERQQAADAHTRDRFELLKIRTGLLGVLGLLGVSLALFGVLAYGGSLWAWANVAWFMPSADIHVPSNLYADLSPSTRVPALLQFAFVAVGLLGVSASSRDALSPLHRKLWLVILGVLAASIVFTQTWSSGDSKSQRQLAAALAKQQWSPAIDLLPTANNRLGATYVQAQIALAQGDPVAVKTLGEALMPQLESLLLFNGTDVSIADGGIGKYVSDFRPEVLRRIDVATYGAPHSQLSLTMDEKDAVRVAPGWVLVLRQALWLVVALVGLILSLSVLWLWWRMTRRVQRLRPWVV